MINTIIPSESTLSNNMNMSSQISFSNDNIPSLINSVSPDGNNLYVFLANRKLILIKNPGNNEIIKSLDNYIIDKENNDIISIVADNNKLYVTAFSRINNNTILYSIDPNSNSNNLIKIPDDIKFNPLDICIRNNKIYILNNDTTIHVYDIENQEFILSNIVINNNLNTSQYRSITVDSNENIYITNIGLNIIMMIINLGMLNQVLLPLSITYNLQLNEVTSNNNGKLYVTNNYNKKIYTYEYSSFFKIGINNILETINDNLNTSLRKILNNLEIPVSSETPLLSNDYKNDITESLSIQILNNNTLKNNLKYDIEKILDKF
jgi:hypothetical protein